MPEYKKFKKTLSKMLEDSIIDHSIDCDHPTCPSCGNKMIFYGHDELGDFPLGEGYWKCNCCGYSLSEDDLDD